MLICESRPCLESRGAASSTGGDESLHKVSAFACHSEYPGASLLNDSSGIWAPALRFHDDTFYLVTTLVDDDRAADDASRWDNVRAGSFPNW
jgi:beta-xylosidase